MVEINFVSRESTHEAKSLKRWFLVGMRRYYAGTGFEGCFFLFFGLELEHKKVMRRLGCLKPLPDKVSRS